MSANHTVALDGVQSGLVRYALADYEAHMQAARDGLESALSPLRVAFIVPAGVRMELTPTENGYTASWPADSAPRPRTGVRRRGTRS